MEAIIEIEVELTKRIQTNTICFLYDENARFHHTEVIRSSEVIRFYEYSVDKYAQYQ